MLHELLTSYEFQRYQKQQIKVMVEVIYSQLTQKPEQAAGAITLAQRLLGLPVKLNSNDKSIAAKHQEVMDTFKLSFIYSDEED